MLEKALLIYLKVVIGLSIVMNILLLIALIKNTIFFINLETIENSKTCECVNCECIANNEKERGNFQIELY